MCSDTENTECSPYILKTFLNVLLISISPKMYTIPVITALYLVFYHMFNNSFLIIQFSNASEIFSRKKTSLFIIYVLLTEHYRTQWFIVCIFHPNSSCSTAESLSFQIDS